MNRIEKSPVPRLWAAFLASSALVAACGGGTGDQAATAEDTTTAGQAGDKVTDLRHRIQDRMDAAQADLARLQAQAVGTARDAGKAADDFVHDQPWTAVGIAAGVGVLVGLLLGRR